MKIGDVKFKNNIILAPMAGVTDAVFRVLCREQGCGFAYTEMVSARGVYHNSRKTIKLLETDPCEKSVGVQIFGTEPPIMAQIATEVNDSKVSKVSLIDINMGCPTPKITKNGAGSALMCNPKLGSDIIKAVVNASVLPVTVKLRMGWDNENVNALQIGKIAEENGASAVTIHGRTRQQFYRGTADWQIIREMKEYLSIPVIGNGDVFSPEDAQNMLDQTGCDAVMLGRASQGNPWIFKKILHYLKTGEILPEPTYEEKISMIVRHMKMLVEKDGEHLGVLKMRKHLAWYIKGMKNSSYIKNKVFKLSKADQVIEVLDEYLEYLKRERERH